MVYINGTLIYHKYMECNFVLGLSNVKLHKRDLPIYSNVRERDDKGLSIYTEVRERILIILLIYLNVHLSATNSSECIANKK